MKKSTISAVSTLAGILFGAMATGRYAGKRINRFADISDKHFALFLMMNQWIKVKQDGKSLAEYLEKKGYKNIAVYGMSYAGKTLVNELKNSKIQVIYGIDKNKDFGYSETDVVSLDDELKEADAVIVTAITFFDEIEEKLSKRMDCPVISLEDILYKI